MSQLQRQARRLATGVWRRINRQSTLGLGWKKQGEFITFRWDGFVEAPSVPLLFARHNYETAVISRLLGGRSTTRSLEFGCGFGRLTPTIASLSARHTAIDINPDAVAAASTAYPHLDFRTSAGGMLPFADATFDLVVTWTVLQHVPPHLIDSTLAELIRVLTPSGCILLCEETRNPEVPTRHSWHRPAGFYEERLSSLRLTYSSYIDEIDSIPGLISPGRVMLFESVGSAAANG